MKAKLFALGVVAGFVGALAGGCSWTPQQAKNAENAVLSAATVACIIAQAETDDATVMSACGVTQDLMPIVRSLVAQQRTASRSYAAAHVGVCQKP